LIAVILVALGSPLALAVAERPLVDGLELVLVAGLTPGFAWLFTRPPLLVERWRAAFPRAALDDLGHEARVLYRRGLVRSELLGLGAMLLIQQGLPALEVVVVAAILLDIGHELRRRLDEPEFVAVELHVDLCGAESLALALRLQQRPAHLQGSQLRALLRLLGWWVPMRVLVRPDDVEVAVALHERSATTKKEAPDTRSGA
jgi:hypothetical protein